MNVPTSEEWVTRLLGVPVITNPNVPKDQVYIMNGETLRSLGALSKKDYSLRARLKRAWRELTEKV